jgi:hypothetical protein
MLGLVWAYGDKKFSEVEPKNESAERMARRKMQYLYVIGKYSETKLRNEIYDENE